jgi:release factor glutamine methyltransferase
MIKLSYKDFLLKIPDQIYLPAEDTFLLKEVLEKENFKNKNTFLEIGAGSGIISLSIYDCFKDITLVDIDKIVIGYLKKLKKEYSLKKLKVIQSDLFSKLVGKKYDVIVFNPPYVPSEDIKVYSTDGGRKGSDIILKFINGLKKHLNKEGTCYLLLSSHNDLKRIYNNILKNHLTYNILDEKNLFFEKLIVLKISE